MTTAKNGLSFMMNEIESAAVRLAGTPNQRERFAAGLLPEDELLGIARMELFKPFDGLPRWGEVTLVRANEVRHDKACAKTAGIKFEAVAAGELTHDEWEAYRKIQEARDTAALHPWLMSTAAITLEPIAHFATCEGCQGEACRSSAKVTIEWAGRKLVREYVLK